MKKELNKKRIICFSVSFIMLFALIYIISDNNSIKQGNITNVITLESSEYSSEVKQLPPIRSLEYILANDDDSDVESGYKDHYIRNIQEYGDIAKRFLLVEGGIMKVEKLNIDKDTEPETIVHFCAYTANRCPHKIVIIKGDKIIFSTTAGYRNLDIKKLESSEEGFYIIWQSEENSRIDNKRNKSTETKFVKINGKFIAISEKEADYIR